MVSMDRYCQGREQVPMRRESAAHLQAQAGSIRCGHWTESVGGQGADGSAAAGGHCLGVAALRLACSSSLQVTLAAASRTHPAMPTCPERNRLRKSSTWEAVADVPLRPQGYWQPLNGIQAQLHPVIRGSLLLCCSHDCCWGCLCGSRCALQLVIRRACHLLRRWSPLTVSSRLSCTHETSQQQQRAFVATAGRHVSAQQALQVR